MNVAYRMVVDFARPTKTNQIIISEGDANSRKCVFTLLFNKQAFDMTSVTMATVKAVKTNGSVIYGDATILTDDNGVVTNEVEYIIPGEMADEAGKVTMTITLASSTGEVITSFEFYVVVRNALYNEDDYISKEDLSGFRDLLNRAMSALEKMEVMVQKESLPNPYPLTISVEGEESTYTGSEVVEIDLGSDFVHMADEGDIEDSVDTTAAKAAAESALSAEASAESASKSAASAEKSASALSDSLSLAEEYATLAKGYQGQALASATLAEQTVSQFSAEISAIKKAINDLGGSV